MTNITYDINKNNTMIKLRALLVTCEKFVSMKLAAFNKRRLQLIIHTLNRPY